jgi:hypothetical protein
VRAFFLLLVLANVAFYAWWRYGPPADAADPAPLTRQIEPEKLKIISPSELPPASTAAKKPAAPSSACMEWGSFTVADAPRAEQALEPLALGLRLAQRRAEEVAPWWVFIPSMGSRQAALKKALEMRNLGIDDYFVVQEEGEHRWALSLGVFRTEEAAAARLAALRAQGVRSARVGMRETVVPRIWLQVKSVDGPLQAQLKEIARQMEGTELKDCP